MCWLSCCPGSAPHSLCADYLLAVHSTHLAHCILDFLRTLYSLCTLCSLCLLWSLCSLLCPLLRWSHIRLGLYKSSLHPLALQWSLHLRFSSREQMSRSRLDKKLILRAWRKKAVEGKFKISHSTHKHTRNQLATMGVSKIFVILCKSLWPGNQTNIQISWTCTHYRLASRVLDQIKFTRWWLQQIESVDWIINENQENQDIILLVHDSVSAIVLRFSIEL